MTKTLLPAALLKEIRSTKNETHPEIYKLACDTILALDEANVLNDQIVTSVSDESDICLQWSYNIFYDIFYDMKDGVKSLHFMVARYKRSTYESKVELTPLLPTLIQWLKEEVDTTDPHDPYRKDKRTAENSEEVISPF